MTADVAPARNSAVVGHAPAGTTPREIGWAEALRVGLGLWALTRLAFVGFALGAMQASPEHSLIGAGDGWFPRLYYWWDSLNFYSVAVSGYNVSTTHPTGAVNNPAFFPGYPLLARLFAMPFGGAHPTGPSLYWSLALVAWAGAAVAAVVIWRLAAEQGGPQVANRAVLLLLVGPYAVFLTASYSESIFLAFAISAWYAGRHRHWWLAGLLGAAAGLVRINGLCLAAGLIVMYVLQRRAVAVRPSSNGAAQSPVAEAESPVASRPPRTAAAALSLPFLGTFGYFAWLRMQTGSWQTWFNAQKYWHRKLTWPWEAFLGTAHYVVHPRGNRLQPTLEIVFAVLAVVLLVALIVQRRWAEAVYVATTFVSMTTSTWFLSLPRLCLLLFPAFVLLAQSSLRRRWVWPTMVTVSVGLLAVNTLTFVYHEWAG